MSIKSSDVYVGWWTNWSKGNSITGATITIPSSSASLLVAFLAVFLSLTASHLWRLTAYVIYCWRHDADQIESRPLRRQQQVVFKSDMSAVSAALLLGEMMWINRSKPAALRDSYLPILLSITCAALGITLSLISSKIISTSPSTEFLLIAHGCFSFDIDRVASFDDATLVGSELATILKTSTIYAQRCYNTTNVEECSPFAATIHWTTNWEAPCPFNETMCLSPAMQLDTGLLNSNTILGVNSPAKDQIEFRKVTTCAPITQKTTLDRTIYSAPNTMLADNITLIPELNVAGGDKVLLFIQTGSAIVYSEQCDDPVFAAHVLFSGINYGTNLYYRSDRLAGVIGCVEQFQICNPTKNHECTSLRGLFDSDSLNEAWFGLSLNSIQNATLNALLELPISFALIDEYDSSLIANQELLIGVHYYPVPSNQWQVEVQGWHATVMASLQQRLISRVSGSGPGHNLSNLTLASPQDLAVCSRQRARTTAGFANVSALNLILALSKQVAWIRNDVLHLQRLAYTAQERLEGREERTNKALLGPLIEYEEEMPAPELHAKNLDPKITPSSRDTEDN
ncbi:hypothetical protein F4803DRAFT_563304 [Xylaria telfairii]|nr:hypothetical protein F4803DRAFT_563304 [Xylaria telfairii]